MSRSSFMEGAVVALVLAVAAIIGGALLPPLIGIATASRLLVLLLAGSYLLHLMRRSRARTGRVLAPCLWLSASALAWWLLPFAGLVLIQALLLSVIRSAQRGSGGLSGILDAGLSTVAVAAAAWAFGSGNWGLAAWTFFLVQALSAWIPCSTPRASRAARTDAAFEAARWLAESALERLATRR